MATTWTRRLSLGTFGAGIALSDLKSLAAQGPATSPGQGAGEVQKDVVFGKGGDVDLHCDIFLERYVLNPRAYPAFGAGRGGGGRGNAGRGGTDR